MSPVRRILPLVMTAAVAAVVSIFSVSLHPAGAAIDGTTWFPIGPAPIDGFFKGGATGRASAVAVNPANADDIWLCYR